MPEVPNQGYVLELNLNIMHGLNAIFSSNGSIKVLRCLYWSESPMSGREVQRQTGLSNRGTMIVLSKLTKSGIIFRSENKHSHFYCLNRKHYLSNTVLKSAFLAENLFWKDVAKTVKRIVKPRPIVAIASGPLAREDICIGGKLVLSMLFSSGRNRIKSLSTMTELANAVNERYGMVLDHQLMDIRTMGSGDLAPAWRRAEREGILLFGAIP